MFDVYLGPSNPLPKEAELVASKNETVVVSRCQDKKKLVTALAVSEDPDGKAVLYSGHDDGTLTKWNLQDNKKIWSRQIYPDESEEEEDRFTCFINVQYTPGVAGLAVRPDPKKKGGHLLYTWTNGEDNDQNKSLKVWSGTDGRLVRVHVCDVGEDDGGRYACPDISTVVFCQLAVKDWWVDSVLVGLHCLCDVLDNDESYTDFDLEESQDYSEGNILPFYEHPTDGTDSMPSWRGHFGMIRAMAVVQDKFLLSYSIRPGAGRADAIILWSLRNPGVPLFRKDLWRETRNVYKQSMTRLDGVCGISVCGKDVLFADEYGRRIAAVKVDEEEKSFKLEGYAQTGPTGEANTEAFHGRMAMSRSFAAIANESDSTVWIYRIEGNSEHPKLDRQDGNIHDFLRSYLNDQESEYSPEKMAGKEIAVARVEIPKFGDDAACSKKRKWDGDFVWDSTMSLSSEDSVGFGDGGPITLALRGRNLITGFSNGTIMNTTLPDRFDEEPNSVSANHLASCSALPSDEWRCPMLECEE